MTLRLLAVSTALMLAVPASADPIDPATYPELAPEVLLPPVIGELKRTLKDPYSVRDLVFCPATKVKLKDGKPVRWSVLLSFNARNGFGGYVGTKMYAAIFRNGRLYGGLTSIEFGNDTGLSGLLNSMTARQMANCPVVPDDKVQQLLSPGGSALRQ